MEYLVYVLGQDDGYTVKYTPLHEGIPECEAWGNSWRERGILDNLSQDESLFRQYIIMLMITSLISLTIS